MNTYVTGEVKWHPGHYVLLPMGAAGEGYMNTVVEELSRYPMLRGIQVRYTWAELEPNPGNYDFSRVSRDLEIMQRNGKHLFILLQTKASNGETIVLPAHLDSSIAGGGTFPITTGASTMEDGGTSYGRNLQLWKPAVKVRFAALVKALGRKFNQHPALEGVALNETAMGTPVDPVTEFQEQQFYANLLAVNVALRSAFPNTVTMQFLNFPKSILQDYAGALTDMGAAVGGPDIFVDDQSLANGVYQLYPTLAGRVPLGPSVQHEDYLARYYHGPYDPPSIDELYQFGRSQLHANYIFWLRMAYDENPWSRVLEYMSSPAFPIDDPAGGLASNCPSAFDRCVD